MLGGGVRMSVEINGEKFYTISEACMMAGTNRNTFLRWVREKKIPDSQFRDRNGWRLFNEEEIKLLQKKVFQIQKTPNHAV
jgi:excisionase family DNA binding protein